MLKILSMVLGITISAEVFQGTKQENTDNQIGYATVEANINSCEINNRYFDILANKIKFEIGGGNETIIIIARLGFREKSSKLNKLRLDKAKQEFIDKRVPEKNIIIAQGEPISSQGRVEFYFQGKLFLVSFVERNKNICTNCC